MRQRKKAAVNEVFLKCPSWQSPETVWKGIFIHVLHFLYFSSSPLSLFLFLLLLSIVLLLLLSLLLFLLFLHRNLVQCFPHPPGKIRFGKITEHISLCKCVLFPKDNGKHNHIVAGILDHKGSDFEEYQKVKSGHLPQKLKAGMKKHSIQGRGEGETSSALFW